MDFYTLALFPLLTTLYILSYYAMFVSIAAVIIHINFICINRDDCSALNLNEQVCCHLLFISVICVLFIHLQKVRCHACLRPSISWLFASTYFIITPKSLHSNTTHIVCTLCKIHFASIRKKTYHVKVNVFRGFCLWIIDPEGITHPIVSVSTLSWCIKYIC